MLEKVKNILKVSLLKTIFINMRYLGFKGIFKPKILVGRNVKLRSLKGRIIFDDSTFNSRLVIGVFEDRPEYSRGCTNVYFNGKIIIKGKVYFAKGTSVSVDSSGSLIIGNNVHIGPNTVVYVKYYISIGSNTSVSYDCYISDTDSHKIFDSSKEKQTNPDKSIIIGEYNWICCRSLILKGVCTKDHTIIGAQSRVTKSIEHGNSIVIDNICVRNNINFEW